MLVGGNVFGVFRRDVVDQNRLAMVDAPHRELILVVRTACIGRVALSVFDRQAVLDQVLLRPIEANAENARVHDLIYALIEFEQDRIEIERGRNLFAISLSSSMLSFCAEISAACARISWVRSLTVASSAFACARSSSVRCCALARS